MKRLADRSTKLNGKMRSPHWGTVRAKFLKGKTCGICGGVKKLEAHHIRPFHLHPEFELDPRNLFPLCEGNKNMQCHLIFGHYGNFRTKYNLGIARFARVFLKKMTAKTV